MYTAPVTAQPTPVVTPRLSIRPVLHHSDLLTYGGAFFCVSHTKTNTLCRSFTLDTSGLQLLVNSPNPRPEPKPHGRPFRVPGKTPLPVQDFDPTPLPTC